MIRVKIDLVPFGNEAEKETIGTLDISNAGELFGGLYNYNCAYNFRTSTGTKEGVTQAPHFRRDHVLKLLYKVVEQINWEAK